MNKESEPLRGLSSAQVEVLRSKGGFNELPTSETRGFLRIAIEIIREPMVYLLLACGLIYFFLGDQAEAMSLLAFLILILGITLFQESKAERALAALRDLSSPRALVLRDGKKMRIPGREVVCEDLILLAEGDRVPADALVLDSHDLACDESLLTGESVPVEKENSNHVFAGTTVVRGSAIARVESIGASTQLGKIGKYLSHSTEAPSLLQLETRNLVNRLLWLCVLLCGIVILGHGFIQGQWLPGILAGLALAMAILPNEIPAVLVIFLALGAQRLSKRNVLTRKLSAIESLGSATVICVDKTGTLTLNKMRIQKLYAHEDWLDLKGSSSEMPEHFHLLLEYGILASRKEPFDPMEKAIHEGSIEYLKGTEHLHPDWALLREYPLSKDLLAMSHAWKASDQGTWIVGAKGAPEAIMDLCHLSESDRLHLNEKVKLMASEGLRVIGVARARSSHQELPEVQHDFDFEFLGLLGLADPVREGVREAIAECYQAGIRVVMITGDHRETAQSIARQIQLKNPDQILTGAELSVMNDEDLKRRVQGISIFSRMSPEQKLRVVEALKAHGEVVAMTGDGVNDAPALKAAHIGIAMGGRGTDVARESASLVLVDDQFVSIVDAIRTGRRIYKNLGSAMKYLLAVHIPIAGIALVTVLFNLPLVLMPIHIAFLHLIIEPACSIAFEAEPESEDLMREPPRKKVDPLFSKTLFTGCLFQGIAVLAVMAAILIVSTWKGLEEKDSRTLTFATLILANLALIFTSRSRRKSFSLENPILWWIVMGSLFLFILVLYVPSFQRVFQFSHLHIVDLMVCLGAGLLCLIWFQWIKKSKFSNT